MRKFIFKHKSLLLFFAISLSSPACLNTSSNSNVAVLYRDTPTPAPPLVEATPQQTPVPSPANSPDAIVSPAPALTSSATPAVSPAASDPFVNGGGNADRGDVASSEKLMIPVVGVKREDLRDTFDDARSEGRVHDAIDIMASGGTPVIAAANGKIIKFFDSERGGITIYELSPDEHTIYYYAHLQRRADDLREGALVNQGDLIGYVGDTGNAGAGNNHLHFAIWTIIDPKHFYDGTNINPYQLLKEGIVKP